MDQRRESKVTRLLKRMTLEERIKFMVDYARVVTLRNRESTRLRQERNAKHAAKRKKR